MDELEAAVRRQLEMHSLVEAQKGVIQEQRDLLERQHHTVEEMAVLLREQNVLLKQALDVVEQVANRLNSVVILNGELTLRVLKGSNDERD